MVKKLSFVAVVAKGKEITFKFQDFKNTLCSVTHTRYVTVDSQAKESFLFMSRTRPMYSKSGE